MQWATKESFFAIKVPYADMTGPDIGRVRVYGLTCGEKDAYQNEVTQISGRKSPQVRLNNARAKLLVMVVRDSQGRPVFTDTDLGKVMEVPAAITEPILDTAWELSGMGPGEVEDMVKNSPSDLPPTGSD